MERKHEMGCMMEAEGERLCGEEPGDGLHGGVCVGIEGGKKERKISRNRVEWKINERRRRKSS